MLGKVYHPAKILQRAKFCKIIFYLLLFKLFLPLLYITVLRTFFCYSFSIFYLVHFFPLLVTALLVLVTPCFRANVVSISSKFLRYLQDHFYYETFPGKLNDNVVSVKWVSAALCLPTKSVHKIFRTVFISQIISLCVRSSQILICFFLSVWVFNALKMVEPSVWL